MPVESKFPLVGPPRFVDPASMMTDPGSNGATASLWLPFGGIKTRKTGFPLAYSQPNQPSIIGWPGSVNYQSPGTFDSSVARPCNGTGLGAWIVYEPANCLFRKGFPIVRQKTLFTSFGYDTVVATIYPSLSAKGITSITLPDAATGIIGGAPSAFAAVGTYPSLLSDFPYADEFPIDLFFGTGQLVDYTQDGGSWMGGDILHVLFCGQNWGPWTTLIGQTFDGTLANPGANPWSGSEAPMYIVEQPGTPTVRGRSAFVFAATAQRQIRQISAILGSINKYHVTIVYDNGNANTPPVLALPGGSTIAGKYPSSWNAIASLVSAPWMSFRSEDYSDPTMPASVIAQEAAAFFT